MATRLIASRSGIRSLLFYFSQASTSGDADRTYRPGSHELPRRRGPVFVTQAWPVPSIDRTIKWIVMVEHDGVKHNGETMAAHRNSCGYGPAPRPPPDAELARGHRDPPGTRAIGQRNDPMAGRESAAGHRGTTGAYSVTPSATDELSLPLIASSSRCARVSTTASIWLNRSSSSRCRPRRVHGSDRATP